MTIILVALSCLEDLGRENLLIDLKLFLHRAELSLGLSKVCVVEEPGEENEVAGVHQQRKSQVGLTHSTGHS